MSVGMPASGSWPGFYTARDVARLAQIPSSTLYEWQQRKIIEPSLELEGDDGKTIQGYTYADLVLIRILRALREDKIDFHVGRDCDRPPVRPSRSSEPGMGGCACLLSRKAHLCVEARRLGRDRGDRDGAEGRDASIWRCLSETPPDRGRHLNRGSREVLGPRRYRSPREGRAARGSRHAHSHQRARGSRPEAMVAKPYRPGVRNRGRDRGASTRL